MNILRYMYIHDGLVLLFYSTAQLLLCHNSASGDALGIWRWNENIVFDISVRDVPRGARLCLAIYAVYGSKKTKKKTGRLEAKGVSRKINKLQ